LFRVFDEKSKFLRSGGISPVIAGVFICKAIRYKQFFTAFFF